MKPIAPKSHDTVTPFPVSIKVHRSAKQNTSLTQVQLAYGPEALRACYMTLIIGKGTGEVVLIPKMRKDIGEEAWEALCPEFKGMVLKLFYEVLSGN